MVKGAGSSEAKDDERAAHRKVRKSTLSCKSVSNHRKAEKKEILLTKHQTRTNSQSHNSKQIQERNMHET
jgi:hypothetical protein